MEYNSMAQNCVPKAEEASLHDVYGLVCTVFGQERLDPAWSFWYVYLSLLKRRDIGRFTGIYKNSMLTATAGIYAQSKSHALIAGVATLPKYRKEGLASRLVKNLAEEITANDKLAFLLCAEDLCGWYEKLGFVQAGIWQKLYIAGKKHENIF